jgi:hypothetical protein
MTPALSNPGTPWWVLPLVLAAVPFFWLALMFLIAHLGGWAALAKACPVRSRPRGAAFGGLSLQIHPATSYGGCISAVFSAEGLYLVPLLLFRFGHRPLLIPWEQVATPVQRRFLWFRRAHLPIHNPVRSARLGLSRKAERWLQESGSQADWRPRLGPAVPSRERSSTFQRESAWRGR